MVKKYFYHLAGVTALSLLFILGIFFTAEAANFYSVRGKDTLKKIAREHGIPVSAIKAANPSIIDENSIKTGQVILIPEPGEVITIAKNSHDTITNEDIKKLDAKHPSRKQRKLASRGISSSLVSTAMRFMGVPYVWAGTTSSGFDCSGFVMRVYLMHGIRLPRMADAQYYAGTKVSKADLKPGDLVFFTTYCPGPSHVGMYIGNAKFIHASSRRGVTISSLNDPYYSARFLGGRRY